MWLWKEGWGGGNSFCWFAWLDEGGKGGAVAAAGQWQWLPSGLPPHSGTESGATAPPTERVVWWSEKIGRPGVDEGACHVSGFTGMSQRKLQQAYTSSCGINDDATVSPQAIQRLGWATSVRHVVRSTKQHSNHCTYCLSCYPALPPGALLRVGL